jgi:8-oxo-dGTP diphosphatase
LAARAEQPRVRVAALMMLDGQVVLVRHRAGSSTYHLLPGGGVDYRETIESALKREILEETGLIARPIRPLFVSDTIDPQGPRHVINLTFIAEILGGALTTSPEDPRVEAVELIEPACLHELDLRPPIAAEITAAIRDGLEAAPTRYLGSLFTHGSDL